MLCLGCELEGSVECEEHCRPEVLAGETTFQRWCGVIVAVILSSIFAYLWTIAAVIDFLIEHWTDILSRRQ